MNAGDRKNDSGISGYHFEWKHLLVLFIILVFFQIIISFIQQISLQELEDSTQYWYKRDSAERIAGLTAASFELLLETSNVFGGVRNSNQKTDMIEAFNIIFSQPLLQDNIKDIFVLVSEDDRIFAINDGTELFTYLFTEKQPHTDLSETEAAKIYSEIRLELTEQEIIYTREEGENSYHVFVPLVPNGEYAGAVYMHISPDFSFISEQVISNYDQTAIIFLGLILFGLLAMFYISSYTVKERDETQRQLYREREEHLREQIDHQKETLFTKRIYHTHHKAEKIMGFIKEDIRELTLENFEAMKSRMNKYANFVSRAIYDMKWYDPPIQTIRGQMFRTDINSVLTFLVDNLFKRISENVSRINFTFDLDKKLPRVSVNEYVVWEVVEPLIQNSIDHSHDTDIEIQISTRYDEQQQMGYIYLEDNGSGIQASLLEKTESGVKRLFNEHESTKSDSKKSGYGCYLAYEIARRCGWLLDVENKRECGCRFSISIRNLK